jgi:hypothetical protein
MSKSPLEAIAALAVSHKLAAGGLSEIEIPEGVVLLVGDEVRLEVVARVTEAVLREKFDAKSGQFIGPLTWTAKVTATASEVTAHRTRAEVEREWSERVSRAG